MKSLPSFLLGGDDIPSPQIIHKYNLASYAYVAIPKERQQKDQFKPDYLGFLNRHYAIKKDVMEILEAWTSQGIDVLLFKGFYLSEFMYPAPGMRFHEDVDIAIHPKDEQKAFDIALNLGWQSMKDLHRDQKYADIIHEAFTIQNTNGGTYIEAHRHLFHSRNLLIGNRKQHKITRQIWEKAETHQWEGINIKLPSPVDAALILALQRFWGDTFQIRPHDPIDLRFLIKKKGVTKKDLMERASELHCHRSVKAFLECCNPWAYYVQLSKPTISQLAKWSLQILPERGSVLFEKNLRKLMNAPSALMDVAFVLPAVIKTALLQRRSADIRKLVATLTPDPDQKNSIGHHYSQRRLVRGVKWSLRFLGLSSPGPCLLRSLSLYRLLRKQGKPAVFVCGLHKVESDVMGHAWVEIDGKVLPELKEGNNRKCFNISIEYPASSSNR